MSNWAQQIEWNYLLLRLLWKNVCNDVYTVGVKINECKKNNGMKEWKSSICCEPCVIQRKQWKNGIYMKNIIWQQMIIAIFSFMAVFFLSSLNWNLNLKRFRWKRKGPPCVVCCVSNCNVMRLNEWNSWDPSAHTNAKWPNYVKFILQREAATAENSLERLLVPKYAIHRIS